eukprot:467288_1
MMADHTRANWKVGSECQVRSKSHRKWVKATITEILIEEDGEWLKVVYMKNYTKDVKRYGSDIKPIVDRNTVNKNIKKRRNRSNALIPGEVRKSQQTKQWWHDYLEKKDFKIDSAKLEELTKEFKTCCHVIFDEKKNAFDETLYNILESYKHQNNPNETIKMFKDLLRHHHVFEQGSQNETDQALIKMLYIGQENIVRPYLHLLADLYARDSIKYSLEIEKIRKTRYCKIETL